MPQPVLHVLIARRTLERWRRDRAGAPVDPDAPGVEDHFLHGALAPDMGFFPGSRKDVSHLVHNQRTGAIVQALHERARTDAERAFVWGWLTHFLADVEIHPIVNEHADRLLAQEGVLQPDHRQRGRAHVRVELGLDAHYLCMQPAGRDVRIRNALDARGFGFVRDALHVTYGRVFPAPELARSHRNVTRFYRLYVLLAALIAAEIGTRERRHPLRLAHLRALCGRLIEPGSQASGFVAPVAPARTFVERTDAALERVHRAIDAHVAHDLRHLADWNLEYGGLMDGAGRPCATCAPAAA